ncbi:MAG: dipeptidyl peptidase 3, partial [Bacteroidia bacterium]|nr:dipeptidyl peptidase 3 [Bacteroidia bacterium]
MHTFKRWFLVPLLAGMSISCNKTTTNQNQPSQATEFKHFAEQFADLQILRYQIPGVEQLSPKQKELVYYLYEAGLSGRDIIWDQHWKYNLTIRKTLEAILTDYKGEKTPEFEQFLVYAKRVFFSNGVHHHYDNYKILPECSQEYVASLIKNAKPELLPLQGKSVEEFTKFVLPLMFDPNIAPLKVNQNPNADMVKTSAVHFYEGVSQKEVEAFYDKLIDKKDPHPISYGLNSTLIKKDGKLVEIPWKVGGMYGSAIEKVVYWLEKAITVAENDIQKQALQKLVEYYQTGDLKKFDEYNILWVKDTSATVDA